MIPVSEQIDLNQLDFAGLERLLRDSSGYPDRPVKPKALPANATPAQLRAHADALEEHEKAMESYHSAEAAYRTKQAFIQNIWDEKLRAQYAHLPNAVYDILYSRAYDDGHSAGWGEVRNYMIGYNELYQSLKAAEKA